MKPAISKQTALKGLLLAVLAVNISWEPFKAFNSYDAALEGAAPTTSRAEEGARLTPAPGARPVGEPRERRTTETVATLKHDDTRTWCGVTFSLHWEKVPNSNSVRAEVIRHFPEDQVLFTQTKSGSFETLVTNVTIRDQWISYMESQTRSRLGKECADAQTVSAGSPTSAGPNTSTTISAEEAAAKKKKLAADIASCRKDSDGKSLDSATRLDCNRERLSEIEPIDEDDRKSKRDSQNKFNEIVRQIQEDLKKEVKDALMNDDQSAARELVDGALRDITTAAKDIEISPSAVQKAVRDIQMMYQNEFKAVGTGKELKNFADSRKLITDEMMGSVEMLQQQALEARLAGDKFGEQNANSQMALLLGQGKMMGAEYNRFLDSRIAQLRGYQSQNFIDLSDYTDFTSSTMDLKAQIAFFNNGGRMTGANGLPTAESMTMPQDFLTYRTQQADRYRSVYGGIPMRPTLNFTPTASVGAPPMPSMPTATFNSGNPNLGRRY